MRTRRVSPSPAVAVIVLLGAVTTTCADSLTLYNHPKCNTLRFRAGCFLDVLEKTCESVKDLQKCSAEPHTCKDQEEFPVTPEATVHTRCISPLPSALGVCGGLRHVAWSRNRVPGGVCAFSTLDPDCSLLPY